MNQEIEKPVETENPVDEEQLKKQFYKNKATSYNKKYYEKNKAKILEDQKIKVENPLCNRIVIKSNLKSKHLKSKLCINTQE